MTPELCQEAMALFRKQYGIFPKEKGLPAIGLYRTLFIFAPTQQEIDAFIKAQDRIRRVLGTFWVCALLGMGCLIACLKNESLNIFFIYAAGIIIWVSTEWYQCRKLEKVYRSKPYILLQRQQD